jgi:hypothetical protein
MDFNQKRFMVGDSVGKVKIYNSMNGELMKSLNDHVNGEILNIMTVKTKEMNMIITVGSNNVIQIHEDEKLYFTAVRRSITIPPNYQV